MDEPPPKELGRAVRSAAGRYQQALANFREAVADKVLLDCWASWRFPQPGAALAGAMIRRGQQLMGATPITRPRDPLELRARAALGIVEAFWASKGWPADELGRFMVESGEIHFAIAAEAAAKVTASP